MNIQSLGYHTDLFFPRFDGEVIDRGDYTVIRTPSNPTYHWGNFLLFSQPPVAGDLARWGRLFAEEIGTPPATEHIAFGWDSTTSETGDIQPFLDAGLRLNASVVLTTQQVVQPPKYNREVAVRPLREDWEWESALQTQIACRAPGTFAGGLHDLQDAPDGPLPSHDPGGAGRVGSGPSWITRRRATWACSSKAASAGFSPWARTRTTVGAASAVLLCMRAARYAFGHMGAETLVMVADEDYHAAGIYESVGFKPTEHQIGMDWWEREDD